MSPKVPDNYKQNKRNDILQAAERVFIRKGFTQVTMKDIVEESKLSRGGVYLYFSSTDEIFRELLDKNEKQRSFNLLSIYDKVSSGNEAIIQLLDYMHNHIQGTPIGLYIARIEYFNAYSLERECHPLLTHRHQTLINHFQAFFQVGMERGYFSPTVDTLVITHFLLSWNEGITLNSIVLPIEKLHCEEQLKILHHYLCYVLQLPLG
ncbi:TetR/AcrR family transcriptional regulator [Paenibacillus sp. KN14-4R]|uniref:TetR/AcrR family transcriptional regulator n=1 Tax=Paenibacillus sp. KN14-4R TaxID=3445773 RepID=UPI003F9FCD3F